MAHTLASVVLVGRPNCGKIQRFNRHPYALALLSPHSRPHAGTSWAQPVEWQGGMFEVTDTGGMFGASSDPLHATGGRARRRAIGEADLLVLVVDGTRRAVSGDLEISQVSASAEAPVIVAITTTDDKRARNVMEFYQLGFDPVLEISAEHGEGVGDLLEAIVQRLPHGSAGRGLGPSASREGVVDAPQNHRDPERDVEPHGRDNVGEVGVAIVGRPNAGKSSLVNRLLREDG